MKVCSTCNVQVSDNFIEFKCPKCRKATIIRCLKCRDQSKAFKCPECNFTGP